MINKITSKTNKVIADALKLKQKKFVSSEGKFLAESKKVIDEALRCGYRPVCFFVTDPNKYPNLRSYDVYVVNNEIMAKLSDFVTPQDIIAIFHVEELKPTFPDGRFLILDRIQNPDNLGAILRSARATDFMQIYLINCAGEYNSKTIRASMGNLFGLKLYHITENQVKDLFANAQLFCADMDGINVFEVGEFHKLTGIIIGNEGSGISDTIRKQVKQTLAIPMKNEVESLNAGVSASILMYEIMKKVGK